MNTHPALLAQAQGLCFLALDDFEHVYLDSHDDDALVALLAKMESLSSRMPAHQSLKPIWSQAIERAYETLKPSPSEEDEEEDEGDASEDREEESDDEGDVDVGDETETEDEDDGTEDDGTEDDEDGEDETEDDGTDNVLILATKLLNESLIAVLKEASVEDIARQVHESARGAVKLGGAFIGWTEITSEARDSRRSMASYLQQHFVMIRR